jgi:serine/threonine protein kinase
MDRSSSALAGSPKSVSSDSDSLREELRHAVSPRYLVEDEIGRGGMAFVYCGCDTDDHRPVAFKVLRPQFAKCSRPRLDAALHDDHAAHDERPAITDECLAGPTARCEGLPRHRRQLCPGSDVKVRRRFS